MNLDTFSNNSSIISSLNEDGQAQPDSSVITITFKWNFGGNEVFVIGSFNDWRESLIMEKRGNEFVLELEIERGVTHEYKFIVDNEWRFAHD